MAHVNPFDLLGDDELPEDPSELTVAAAKKATAQKNKVVSFASAHASSKPLPPAQPVREAKTEHGRGGVRGYGSGRGGGFNKELANEEKAPRNRQSSGIQSTGPEIDARRPSERRGGYGGFRGSFHGVRGGSFAQGDLSEGERPRKVFGRRSGIGHGHGVIEEGVEEGEKDMKPKRPSSKEFATDTKKITPADEAGEKEPEEKEMTLEEFSKVLEEKRKAVQALKIEARKVDTKEFDSMQPLNKKSSDDVFVQLGGKDKKKEYLEKEEKVKKSLSINEFLKSAKGEQIYPSGRGRGHGIVREPSLVGGYAKGVVTGYLDVPSIEDPGQFPTLAGK